MKLQVHVQQHIHNTVCKIFVTDEDDLDVIVTELKDISDVLKLGLALGIRKSALDKIMQDKINLEKQMIEVIHYWLTRREIVRQKQGECPAWSRLADAVDRLNPSLSEKIRHQHC